MKNGFHNIDLVCPLSGKLSRGLVEMWMPVHGIIGGLSLPGLVRRTPAVFTGATPVQLWQGSDRGPIIRLDGTDDLATATLDARAAGGWSMVFHVRVNGTGPTNKEAFQIPYNSGSALVTILTRAVQGDWRIEFRDTGGGTQSTNNVANIVVGSWYHWVLVPDPTGGIDAYLNGVKVADLSTGATAETTSSAAGPVILGKGSTVPLDIQCAAWYNRSLSAPEISALYREAISGYPTLLRRRRTFLPSGRSKDLQPIVYDKGRQWDKVDLTRPVVETGLNRGLVGWWFPVPALAGGLTLYNLTKNRLHATLNNMDPATDWLLRQNGSYSLDLDGDNDYITVPGMSFNPGVATFTFRLRMDDVATFGAGSRRQGIIDANDGGSQYLRIWLNNNSTEFWIDLNGNSGTYFSGYNRNTALLVDGAEYYVAVVIRAADNGSLYFNGVDIGLSSTSGAGSISAQTNWVLGDSGQNARYLDGGLGDIRIYNRALSAAEVRALYNESLAGYPTLLRRGVDWVEVAEPPPSGGDSLIKAVASAINVAEALVRSRMMNRIASEIINLDEALVRPRTMVRQVATALNLAEAAVYLKAMTRSIADTLNIVEVRDNIRGIVRSLSTVLNLSQVLARPMAMTRSVATTVNASEVLVRARGITRQIATSLILDESKYRIRSMVRSAAEVLNVGDALNRISSMTRQIATSVNISESRDKVLGIVRQIASTLNIAESLDRARSMVRDVSEAINIGEAMNRLITTLGAIIKAISESVNIAESLDRARSMTRSILSSLGIGESIDRARTMIRDVSEALQISEVLNRLITSSGALIKAISTTVNISESADRARSIIRSMTESVNLSEAMYRIRTMIRSQIETINNVEILVRSRSMIRSLASTLNVSEALDRLRGFVKMVDDTLNISESIIQLRGIVQAVSDALSLSETMYRIRSMIRSRDETLDVAEGLFRTRSMIRILSTIIDLAEGSVAVQGFVRVIDESISITESLARRVGLAIIQLFADIRILPRFDAKAKIKSLFGGKPNINPE